MVEYENHHGREQNQFHDWYSILGVSRNASNNEIRKAYKRRIKECHPDRFPLDSQKENQSKLLNEGRAILLSPGKRTKFDDELLKRHTLESEEGFATPSHSESEESEIAIQSEAAGNALQEHPTPTVSDFEASESESLRPVRTRPAFIGLVHRAGAYLFDGIFLYMVAWGLEAGLRPALLALNPLLPWLGLLLGFLYFALLEGPLGRGRTIGKTLFNMQVVTAEGTTPGWPVALKRALLKSAVWLCTLDSLAYPAILPESVAVQGFIVLQFLMLVARITTVGLALSISLHPYKRGLHDLLAGTFVTGDPTPAAFGETLAAEPDQITRYRLRVNPRLALIFLTLSTMVIIFRPVREFVRPSSQVQIRQTAELQRLSGLGDWRLTNLSWPDARSVEAFNKQVAEHRAMVEKTGGAIPTTDSLRLAALHDGSMIVLQAVKVSGALIETEESTATLLLAAERFRSLAWEQWTRLPAEERAARPAAIRFRLQFVEPMQILFYNSFKALRYDGPADPTGGPVQLMAEPTPTPPQPIAPAAGDVRAEADARDPRNADNPTTGGR